VAAGVIQRNSATSQVQRAEEQFLVLSGSASFLPRTFPLDPESAVLFPRLSQVTSQYQKFSVQSLSFNYTPSCPTSTQGTVYMAFVPDTLAELPTSVGEVKGLLGCVSTPAWTPSTLTVTGEMMNKIAKEYYLRGGIGADNLNNAGLFLVAVDGFTGTAKVGALSVKYVMCLHQPRTLPGGSTLSSAVDTSTATFFTATKSPLRFGSYDEDAEEYTFTRQTSCPLLLVLKGTANVTDAPVVTQAGTDVTYRIAGTPGTTDWIIAYNIPASSEPIVVSDLALTLVGVVTMLNPRTVLPFLS